MLTCGGLFRPHTLDAIAQDKHKIRSIGATAIAFSRPASPDSPRSIVARGIWEINTKEREAGQKRRRHELHNGTPSTKGTRVTVSRTNGIVLDFFPDSPILPTRRAG